MPIRPVNWTAVLCSGFIPVAVGFVWYSPKVFGRAWLKAADLSEETIPKSNIPLRFGISILFATMLAVAVMPMVIHQMHIFATLMKQPGFGKEGSTITIYLTTFMKQYGGEFRTFQHGAFHGIFAGLFLVLPIVGTNALFERRGFRYIAIHVGYWTLCLTLMGGVICAWAPAS